MRIRSTTTILAALLLAAACAAPRPARAQAGEFLVTSALAEAPAPAADAGLMVSPLVLQSSTISGFDDARPREKKDRKARAPRGEASGMGLGPERARILLQSLTVPGWGQATLGHRHAAGFFGTLELGIWGAFTAFKVQEHLRRHSYEREASLFAGIDLSGRDEEFRRIVGAFTSSDEYNLLVVSRDAANLYLSDPTKPDMAGYRAYIAQNSLSGKDAWSWGSIDELRRYGGYRKNAQRAGLRANTALGLAIANRLVSALHAARLAGHESAPATKTSWNVEVGPAPGEDPTAVRAGLRARF